MLMNHICVSNTYMQHDSDSGHNFCMIVLNAFIICQKYVHILYLTFILYVDQGFCNKHSKIH